jgi:thiol-disulfide isomerase/thioredoxin
MKRAMCWSACRTGAVVVLLGAAAAGDTGARAAEPNRNVQQRDAVVAESPPQCRAPSALMADTTLRTYGRADYRWALESLDGDTLTLARFRGKVLFINVWATWCPPCIAELGSIERLAQSLTSAADSSIAMLLITPERRGTVVPVVRRRALTTPVYLERKRTPGAWALFGLPTSYVVAPDGSIVLHHRGAARWDTDDVRAFLRALGCR